MVSNRKATTAATFSLRVAKFDTEWGHKDLTPIPRFETSKSWEDLGGSSVSASYLKMVDGQGEAYAQLIPAVWRCNLFILSGSKML